MKNKKITVTLACAGLTISLLTGCGGTSKEQKEARTAGITALEAGDYAGAIQKFDQAISADSGKAGSFEIDVLKYRGEAEYELGDYEAAAHTYEILMQVDKERPEYMYLQTMAWSSQIIDTQADEAGKLQTAVDVYTKAYAEDHKAQGAETAMILLGTALENQGRSQDAMNMYQQAMDAGKPSAELYNHMGICMLGEKKYEEAMNYFQQGITLNDESQMADLKYNEAVVYEFQGDFAKALELFQSYVTTYGSNEEAEREIAFLQSR